MRRIVAEQTLGFIATVCEDGTPNLSPRGTLRVWDDTHLVFADIRSPGTMRNLRANPSIEVNVVDPLARRGYRFKGTARIVSTGAELDEIVAFYENDGIEAAADKIKAAVLIEVTKATAVTSPAYDWGSTEEELTETYYTRLKERLGR